MAVGGNVEHVGPGPRMADPSPHPDARSAAPAASAVRARGLVKTFGHGRAARRVLDGADLDVAPGEVVAIVGRSGSGKSTLLHLVGALDRLDSGELEVVGRPLHRLGERALTDFRRRQVGFVFQFFHLVPELTGEGNVAMPTRLLPERRDGRARARALIHQLGLDDVSERLPHTLSGGEQQRFAIARAVVNDPALLLADEPTGNLDAPAAETVLDVLRNVAGKRRAVLLATHDPAAAEIADRVLHLEAGRLSG